MRMRSELSKKNQYWISKHRYLELYHFCLQYPEWKKKLASICILPDDPGFDPTGEIASRIAGLRFKIELVEWCARNADAFIGGWILEAVTKGLSYDTLWSKYHIPASKDLYFNRYHKFFWLLDSRK